MLRLYCFALAVSLALGPLYGQEQYAHLVLNNPQDKYIRLTATSFMKYGVVNTDDGQEHFLRFFQVPPDSIAYVKAQLSPLTDNDVLMALYDPNSDGYYGFWFRNDSCYYYHDKTFHFMHLYALNDTFEIVRCGRDYSYRKNGTEDFVFTKPVQDPMEVVVRNTFANHATGYIEYGFLDTCSISTIQTSNFYELNILPSGSYAIVSSDTLYFRVTTSYQVVPGKSEYLYWTLYDHMHYEIATDSIKNNYGSNIYAIDLTPYSLDGNVLYELEVYHLNKERTYLFRFKILK